VGGRHKALNIGIEVLKEHKSEYKERRSQRYLSNQYHISAKEEDDELVF
jgi:hypothetical protein